MLFGIIMVDIDSTINKFIESEFKVTLDTIISTASSSLELKTKIAEQKKEMFLENTHNWNPLLPKTISNKTRIGKRGGLRDQPDTINVQGGLLMDEFTNTANININKDFQISFKITGKSASHLKIAEKWRPSPVEITDDEYNEFVGKVADIIANKLNAQTWG